MSEGDGCGKVSFCCYEELQNCIKDKGRKEFIQLNVKDSRTIASTKQSCRVKRPFNEDLQYFH